MVSLDVLHDGASLALDFAGLRIQLAALPVKDFPDACLPRDWSHRFTIPTERLALLLEKTAGCMSCEEIRYYLNGVFLHVVESPTGPILRAVATDGHRLARQDVPIPLGADGMPGVIIPAKTVGEVLRLAGAKGAPSTCSVRVAGNGIEFVIGDVSIRSKVIDGTFPAYERVIPAGNPDSCTVDRARLIDATKQVSVISSERGRAVKVSPMSDRLTLTVVNPDAGSATMDVPTMYGQEEPSCEFGINARYLVEALDTFAGDDVTLRTADPGSPILFESIAEPDFLMVIMPVRV